MNKLGGFGPVYVINLPRRTDRREHMEKLFKDYDITNYTFIDAFDGKENIHQHMHEGERKNDKAAKRAETAACMSHLKAIKHWLDTSDSEYAMFAEDDLSMDTVQYWPWTWQEFLDAIYFDYDVLQLCLTQFNQKKLSMHKRYRTDYSAGLYMLKRSHAQKVINRMIIDGKYNVNTKKDDVIADHGVIMGGTDRAYACGLFIYDISMPSDINPSGLRLHTKCRDSVITFWKQNKMSLKEFID
jgi:hypothetical protein